MAQSKEARKARRDEYAKSLINPDTGLAYKNYNQLDTWRRNNKAKAEGYKTRAEKRYKTVTLPLIDKAKTMFPKSWKLYASGRKVTETSAREFMHAFGPYPSNPTEAYKERSKRIRAKALAEMDAEWNWKLWREEYGSI